jgi:hypothetical protein
MIFPIPQAPYSGVKQVTKRTNQELFFDDDPDPETLSPEQ